ncbi:hypothetical protein FB45DRAFT_890620 [Roridomyces roridus]|uniref:F-box domain-containing protein n=1 Tax=Roridomyces roridus TaxID=1738132 RepID=A0AAD7CDT5_9AGAR|nr:hypothetical protein FB45DRAFT_890620 [Roridomyces roridus]
MEAPPSFTLPDSLNSPASLAHLLASNSAPEGLESRIASAHLAELEEQAAFLEGVMAACVNRQADVLRSIQDHKSILSPVRRLPNELLVEIFMVVVRDAFYSGSPDSGPLAEYPWILQRVCRRWNVVALSTHTLWSWVYLDLDSVDEDDQGVVPVTQLFHERSGGSPLTLRVTEEEGKETDDVFKATLAHAERWQHLSLSLKAGSLLALDLDSVRGRLAALTTLKISAEIDAFETRFDEPMDSFTTAPNLTAVQMWIYDNNAATLLLPPFPLPWKQLTRLSITFASTEEALPILPQLSRIVELRLVFSHVEDVVLPPSSITLPALRCLEVKQTGYVHSTTFSLLDCLTCPILGHLLMERAADVDVVLRFITRSDCSSTLHSLYFLFDYITAEKALSLVREIPRLAVFHVGNLNDAPDLMVQALHAHWLTVRGISGTSRLSVRLVNGYYLPHIPIDNTHTFLPMQEDGLYIEFGEEIESVIDSKFH